MNLLLFSVGKMISVFGSSIYTFAMGLYVLKMTGSGSSFAVTLALGILPVIVINPFAGAIADKFNKKVLVITMDLLSGGLLIGVYLVSSEHGLGVPLVYCTTFLLTVFSTFFGIALESAKPEMVPERLLMRINTINRMIDSSSAFCGPVIGGIIFAWVDIRLFILINGISFLVSAVCEVFIDFRLNRKAAKMEEGQDGRQAQAQAQSRANTHAPISTPPNILVDMKEGFLFLMGSRQIKGLFLILIGLNFFLGFSINVPLPYIINTVLGLSPEEYGIVQSAFPVGMILGAVCVDMLHKRMDCSKLIKTVNFVLAICMVAIALPVIPAGLALGNLVYTAYYCVIMAVLGIAVSFLDIPLIYMLQTAIPEAYRGRVFGIWISIGKAALPVALLISGGLIGVLPAFVLPVVGGVLLGVLNSRLQ